MLFEQILAEFQPAFGEVNNFAVAQQKRRAKGPADPKADVVTGTLKANLSGRVCLRMTDGRQSQVVLGQAGAERLLGKGDLLFQDIGEPKRLQAAYLPEQDRKSIFNTGEY